MWLEKTLGRVTSAFAAIVMTNRAMAYSSFMRDSPERTFIPTLLQERKPGDKRGELFVSRPWGAKGGPETGEAANKLVRLKVQGVRGGFK